MKFEELVDMSEKFRNLVGAIEYIVLLLEDATTDDIDEDVYIKMVELLSISKDKSLRNEAIIIIGKLKNIVPAKNSIKTLADDDNLEINRGLYEIFLQQARQLDCVYQKEILEILSTKTNNEFLHTPIEFIIDSYDNLSPTVQELVVVLSKCNFINTKRILSKLVSPHNIPINIYGDMLKNLSAAKDNLIIYNIIESLSLNLMGLEDEDIENILNNLIENEGTNLAELGKQIGTGLNNFSEYIIKEYINRCIEHGDEWAKLQAIFLMDKGLESKIINVDYEINNFITKFLDDSNENISDVAGTYFIINFRN